MSIRNLIVVILSLGLLACADMSRHPESGYSYKDQRRYGSYRNPAAVRPTNHRRLQSIQDRKKLKKLEQRLESKNEREQYYNYQTYFRGTRDKIKFLEQPTMAARDAYMKKRVFRNKKQRYKQSHLKLIENRDIALGMTRDEIKQSWGEPDHKSFAGEEFRGNEKWSYDRRLKTVNGFVDQKREVIFEGGRVAGWKTK